MADHSSVQFTKGYNDICARMFGANGAVANVKRFVESIRSGKLINNAAQGAESTLTAIPGREAAYRGGEVSWDELIAAKQQYDAGIRL